MQYATSRWTSRCISSRRPRLSCRHPIPLTGPQRACSAAAAFHVRTGTCERPAKEGVRDAPYRGWKGGLPKTFSDALGAYTTSPAQEGDVPGTPTLPYSPINSMCGERPSIGRPSREGERACAPLRRDLLFQPIVKLRGPSRVLHFTHAHVCTLQARP